MSDSDSENDPSVRPNVPTLYTMRVIDKKGRDIALCSPFCRKGSRVSNPLYRILDTLDLAVHQMSYTLFLIGCGVFLLSDTCESTRLKVHYSVWHITFNR